MAKKPLPLVKVTDYVVAREEGYRAGAIKKAMNKWEVDSARWLPILRMLKERRVFLCFDDFRIVLRRGDTSFAGIVAIPEKDVLSDVVKAQILSLMLTLGIYCTFEEYVQIFWGAECKPSFGETAALEKLATFDWHSILYSWNRRGLRIDLRDTIEFVLVCVPDSGMGTVELTRITRTPEWPTRLLDYLKNNVAKINHKPTRKKNKVAK